jgi:4-amino-4-deoxy-L-arabinose transferase-like glycosyltransferase
MLCGVLTGAATSHPPIERSVTEWKPTVSKVFRHQPRWVLPILGAVLVFALVLYTWNIGYSGFSTYYAASVKSMLENPRAVFFGALDPSLTVTLDKLDGFLVPQALSAWIFGFHAWALSLPQVVEGLVTILASYVIGTRWRGPAFGLGIAAIMAATPMLAAMFGRPMEDGMLTMCMVLAFAAWQRALIQRSVLWLSVSGIWIAIGFQAKMLQAWLILPALLIAYLICAAIPVRRRIWHLAVAGVVTLVLSLSWMTAIQLVPAGQRPFIDGTTSNNTATSLAGMSVVKLVLPQFTTQMGWLYPAAAVGAALEIVALRRRFVLARENPMRAGPANRRYQSGVALAFILWLVITGLVMSFAFVPHATYLAVLTLPLTALAVAGAVGAARCYRRAGGVWAALPALVLVQTIWAASIALAAATQLRDLAPVILAGGLTSSGALVALRLRPPIRARLTRAALVGAIATALVGPVVWSLCVLGPGGGGSASDAFAGPRIAAVVRPGNATITKGGGFHLRPPFSVARTSGLDASQQRLLDYVNARNERGTIAFATDTMAIAVSVILATHERPFPWAASRNTRLLRRCPNCSSTSRRNGCDSYSWPNMAQLNLFRSTPLLSPTAYGFRRTVRRYSPGGFARVRRRGKRYSTALRGRSRRHRRGRAVRRRFARDDCGVRVSASRR